MKIKPCPGQIYVKMEEATAGLLDTSSRESAVECAEVLAVGENIAHIKKGDKLFIKSWGIDSVYHQDKRYNFVNVATDAILAIVE